MSLPRRLVTGRTHAITRRTARRTFMLRPVEEVNQIVLYALGLAQQKHVVQLHAYFAESTHHHQNATDDGSPSNLPDFERDLHALIARALNAHYGRGENLWASGSYDNVEISDTATLEEQLIYLWTQSVKDGLTATPEEWPGVRFLPEDFGKTFVVPRPRNAFFGGRRPDDWEPTDPAARAAHRRRHRASRERSRGAGSSSHRGRHGGRPRPGARPKKERAPRPEGRATGASSPTR